MRRRKRLANEIKNAYRDNEKLAETDNIPVPPLEEVLSRFEAGVRQAEKPEYHWRPGYVMAAASVAVMLFFTGLLIYARSHFPPVGTPHETIAITNPLEQVNSLAEAARLTGFTPKAPSYLPTGYELDGIYVVSVTGMPKASRLVYRRDETHRLVLDQAPAGGDDAGTPPWDTGGNTGGDAAGVTEKIWRAGDFWFRLTAASPMPAAEFEKIMNGVQ